MPPTSPARASRPAAPQVLLAVRRLLDGPDPGLAPPGAGAGGRRPGGEPGVGGHQAVRRARSVTRSRSSASLSSVSADSPRTSTESASDPLAAEQLGDPLLDGAGGDHPVHLHRSGLPDPVGPVAGLLLDRGVPPAVEVDDVVGAGEVEAGAAGLQGQQEDRHLPGLEARDQLLPLAHRRAAVEEQVGHPVPGEVALEQPRHRDVLGEDEHGAVLGDGRCRRSRRAGRSSPRLAQHPLLEEVGGVVADLLEAGEHRQHQARGRCVLVGALDPLEAVAHERLVEHDLLAGEGEQVVGVGARRQLRRDAGVGLAATQQERRDQLRNRAVTAGSTPASIGAAQIRRKALRLPSSPGVAQSRIAHSSVSSFSTGVPVRATRAARRDRAQRAGGRRAGVLDVLGLVGDDQVPGDLGQRLVRRAASSRRW